MIDLDAVVHKPVLTGDRVALLPMGPEHADALYAMVQEPVTRRLTGTHREFGRDEIDRWCATRSEQTDRLDWVVTDRADGRVIGDAALNEIDADNESAGYRIALAPDSVGRGLGTEATRLVLGHAFGAIGLHRVQLEVFDFNERAIRSYTRCGFVLEGRLRDALVWDGSRHDTLVMGALRPTDGDA